MTRLRFVTTESGTLYEFKYEDGRTLVRRTSAESLRRDRDWVELYSIVSGVEIGSPMALLLDIRQDGTPTLRSTTPIIAIGSEP